jgi:outer membrane receptor protein involved in Fe transport
MKLPTVWELQTMHLLKLKRIERNYNNFLPYLSFNYAINDKNNISYSFSSRMRRPSFWELNPVKISLPMIIILRTTLL